MEMNHLPQNLKDEYQRLLARKDELILAKRECEIHLTKSRNVIRTSGVMDNKKYKQCVDSQGQNKEKILKIEREIVPLNARLRELNDIEGAYYQSAKGDVVPSTPIKELIVELVALRQHYQEFSADSTRVSSMRQMAADFVIKLNPIIRKDRTEANK